mmetsp:Transcript_81016/g.188222  ORF Transcript_81016/g.188222 Transcript_81016/m.188222 type:complete len:213 (+) Transcript_81016:707-1345(+)
MQTAPPAVGCAGPRVKTPPQPPATQICRSLTQPKLCPNVHFAAVSGATKRASQGILSGGTTRTSTRGSCHLLSSLEKSRNEAVRSQSTSKPRSLKKPASSSVERAGAQRSCGLALSPSSTRPRMPTATDWPQLTTNPLCAVLARPSKYSTSNRLRFSAKSPPMSRATIQSATPDAQFEVTFLSQCAAVRTQTSSLSSLPPIRSSPNMSEPIP